ncbi:MAG: ribbon-helix-helix protein, CopG family [Rhodospirillum sp.]|nr:ribbon-helix-helix protein, CopG family [Rhodospirillum sp.]MCF8502113.1 ribbon-helix-helix protein, CopG family [Rhodospirillum sp.]
MPTTRHKIETYLNDEEKARLDKLTRQLRLSRSELLRRLLMGERLPDASDFVAWQGIRDVLKVNADLARLGNLFKLALDELEGCALTARLTTLAGEIAATQGELKAVAREIRTLVQPSRG